MTPAQDLPPRAHAVLASGAVTTPDVQPPWRWRAFAPHTRAAGFDDQRARALLLAALVGADDAENLAAVAARLDTSERTVVRARVWLKTHDPAAWALLRPREAGPDAATRARIPGWTRDPGGPKPRGRKKPAPKA